MTPIFLLKTTIAHTLALKQLNNKDEGPRDGLAGKCKDGLQPSLTT